MKFSTQILFFLYFLRNSFTFSSFSKLYSPNFDYFRSYENFELENKLKVLVVSDQTQKNGLILSIDVGSSHEPRNIPGLAHLLEHMLFYSSKKYPKEYYFKNYLSNFQGFMNAHTWDDETVFFFELADKKLDDFVKAIDIFSRFFIDPIFKEEAILREINAVHNEYENFLLNDQWRFQEVLRNLANKDSIFNHFQIGDNQHLKSKNISILLEITKFFKEFYSAHKMHLVVYSNHPNDIIKKMIKEKFSLIPNNKKWIFPKHFNPKITNSNFLLKKHHRTKKNDKLTPFNKSNLGLFIWYKSSTNANILSIVFPLQNNMLKIDSKIKPLVFIRRLFMDRSKNSLFSFLKRKNLITDMFTTLLDKHINFKLLSFKFSLNKIDETTNKLIIGYFFSYVKWVLKFGVRKHIYKKISFDNYLDYFYEEKKSTIAELENLMSIFKTYTNFDKNILEESQNLIKFDKIHIEKYLNYISKPQNSLIVFSSSAFTIKSPYKSIFRFKNSTNNLKLQKLNENIFFKKKMDYFDSTMNFYFAYEKISPQFYSFFLNSNSFILNSTKFLKKNIYYPTKFDIVTNCDNLKDELKKYGPNTLFSNLFENSKLLKKRFIVENRDNCLNDEKKYDINKDDALSVFKEYKIQIWIKSYRIFKVPKIASMIQLKLNNENYSSLEISIVLQILCKSIESLEWEILNQIRDAHNEIRLEVKENAIQLFFYGFSDKHLKVVHSILDIIKKIQISEQIYLKNLMNLWGNALINSETRSCNHLFYYFDCFLNSKLFLEKEMLNEIKTFSFKKFISILHNFRNKFSLKAIFVGNILEKTGKKVGNLLQKFIGIKKNSNKLKQIQKNKTQSLSMLKRGISTLILKELSSIPGDKNGAVLSAYYKSDYTLRDVSILDLIFRHLETEAFKFLRTKHQLGYNVAARAFKNKRIIGVYFYMKGSRYDASKMDQYGENFIREFRESILLNKELYKQKQVIENSISNKASHIFVIPDLRIHVIKYFDRLIANNSDNLIKFKKQSKEINIDEIISFYDKLFLTDRKKISFQLFNLEHQSKLKKNRNSQNLKEKVIYSINDFYSYLQKIN